MPHQELSGQTAVVTGSSSGIGRAIALELAAAGAACLIHARQSGKAAGQVADQICAEGGQADVVLFDLADPDHCIRLADHAWQWRGNVDVWINNAGANVLTGKALNWSFERKLEVLWQVDVRATLQLSRLIGQRMKSRGRGVIVNMGWDQAEQGMAGESGQLFAAAKGAVMAATKSLARSLAPEVRVNCLAPGWIRTAWAEKASDYWQDRAAMECLLGRWGTPEDVGGVARFLASPASGFITGQTIPINGGFDGSQPDRGFESSGS